MREATTYAVPTKPPSRAETAKIFFGMLELNGISCASCSESGCIDSYPCPKTGIWTHAGFLCIEWEATSPPEEET